MIPKSLKLTWHLIRIPRLFCSLILFPLVLSLGVVVIQLSASGVFLSYLSNSKTTRMKANLEAPRTQSNWLRKMLIQGDFQNDVTVCHWQYESDGTPIQPSEDCGLDRYDVVVHPEVLDRVPLETYTKMLTGSFARLHVCGGCVSDIIISTNGKENRVDFRSLLALSLFKAVEFTKDYRTNYLKAVKNMQSFENSVGKRYLVLSGFIRPTAIDTLATSFVIVMNISLFVITSLWLALRSHRKVLDYFAHSGALLPMVAANGKYTFYSTIWLLTILRVLGFAAAALPLGFIVLAGVIRQDITEFFFHGEAIQFWIWIVSIVASMTLTTLIASLAELQSRHSLLSFTYKLYPALVCFAGGLLWGITFFFEIPQIELMRTFILAVPLLGLPPLLMAPIFSPEPLSIAINTILTTALIVYTLQTNAHWFSAHLEDI